jgi:hypothetical protein
VSIHHSRLYNSSIPGLQPNQEKANKDMAFNDRRANLHKIKLCEHPPKQWVLS